MFHIDQIVEHAGDRWAVEGVGVTRDDGLTYVVLASTTRFRQQRNGAVPVRMADWLRAEDFE